MSNRKLKIQSGFQVGDLDCLGVTSERERLKTMRLVEITERTSVEEVEGLCTELLFYLEVDKTKQQEKELGEKPWSTVSLSTGEEST